jgi:hypothetical protein
VRKICHALSGFLALPLFGSLLIPLLTIGNAVKFTDFTVCQRRSFAQRIGAFPGRPLVSMRAIQRVMTIREHAGRVRVSKRARVE